MSDYFRKPQIMKCPACGATLAVPDTGSFKCDYCATRVIVPPELRPKKIPPSVVPAPSGLGRSGQLGWQPADQSNAAPSDLRQTRTTLLMVALASVMVLLTGLVVFILMLKNTPSTPSGGEDVPGIQNHTPLPTLVQFARLAMVFGSKGDQPGQFTDARSIAVDNSGNIFVADYSSGRINKFDPQGNFLMLIQVPSINDQTDPYIFSIAADDLGSLYVACAGQILKFDGSTGKLVMTISDQWPEIYYQSVAVAPDGNLYTTNGMAGADDVIILSPEGKILSHWISTIENVNHDDPAIELALGVSHAGTVYLLSPMGNKVYGFNPDGSFKFSFGEQGDRAGQFALSTGMLTITSQDFLVISDVYRVDLFDPEGTYLGKSFTIDYNVAGGSMFGMTRDASDDLYFISSGGKVLKFDMNYP